MAAQAQPPQPPQPLQPDFVQLVQCFENAADQISRFPNIPAFNQGDIIITQLRNITQSIGDLRNEVGGLRNDVGGLRNEVGGLRNEIGDLRNEMGARFDASEANALARLHNSAINRLDIPLYSIKDRRNNPVNGFPADVGALVQLSGNELSTLLRAFGQSTDGNIAAKRLRFRKFIGIVTEI